MKNIYMTLFICCIIIMTFNILPLNVNSETLTVLGNPGSPNERIIILSGESNGNQLMDVATYINIPLHKGKIINASMKLTALDNNGNYPLNPKLDVGLDGDFDWEFNGKGYGTMGHQTVFSIGSTERGVYFFKPGTNNSIKIRLPRNANVISATMNISGFYPEISNGNFETGDFSNWTIEGPYSASIHTSTPDSSSYAARINIGYQYPSHSNTLNENWETVYQTIQNIGPYLHFWQSVTGWGNHWGGSIYLQDDIDLFQLYNTGGGYRPWAERIIRIPDQYIGRTMKLVFCSHNKGGSVSDTGTFDFDDVYFSDSIGQFMTNLPSDVSLDIGNDGGQQDWQHQGELKTTMTINNFSSELNQLLSLLPYFTDQYGNQYVDIPLNISSDTQGVIAFSNLSIKYDHTAIVDINPNSGNLAKELNDIIPKTGSGNFTIYLGLSSESSCKLKISDINIEYNAAPSFNNIPSTYRLDEGSNNNTLINLADYFLDDYQTSENLTYLVESYTNSNYIGIKIYNQYYLSVDSTQFENWFGVTNIIVSATDSEGIKTYSNEFTVTIYQVDNIPRIGYKIPNLTLVKSETNRQISFGNSGSGYFIDSDSDKLYFKAIVDSQYNKNISAIIDNINTLVIKSIGDYCKNVPVRIYCDDEPISNIENITTYQDILVNVTGPAGGCPPIWFELPDLLIPEDTIKKDYVKLIDYVNDVDDIDNNLIFSIVSINNSANIDVGINLENRLDILPHKNFDGTSSVVLKVEDDERNYALTQFNITMIPQNDIPTVEIIVPSNNKSVSGKVIIRGNADDVENDLKKVEIKIGDLSWQDVEGHKYWTYEWNTIVIPNGNCLISARSFDGVNYSIIKTIEIMINNAIDSDADGVIDSDDLFPYNPNEWVDSDGDGYGDNYDVFDNDSTQVIDTDRDGYGDNISGNNADKFPLDPTQWHDRDGDGYGDNPEGNHPDEFPDDSLKHRSNEKSEKSNITSQSYKLYLIIILLILLVIDIILIFNIVLKKEKLRNDK